MKSSGFTLIELLIVIVVIGILAAIAIPAYNGYLDRAARADGQALLLTAAQQLERCYTRTNSYGCDFERDSQDGFYSISTANPIGTQYTLVAKSSTRPPAPCDELTLNHLGVRGPPECWN